MSVARRFFGQWSNWIGLVLVLAFVGSALAAPLLSPPIESKDPGRPGLIKIKTIPTKSFVRAPLPPGPLAVLGTTDQHEDIFSYLVWGTQEVIQFSLKVVILAAAFGIIAGAFAGYTGGWLGGGIIRVSDGFLAVPVIAGFFVLDQIRTLIISSYPDTEYLLYGFGNIPPQLKPVVAFDPLMWAIILFSWMPYTRMTYAMVKRIKPADYIQASQAMGASPLQIIFKHLLPNSISPCIVMLARDFGAVVLLQAGLAFAGFGNPTLWVNLLNSQRKWIISAGGNPFGYWWVWLPVTLALVLYGIGWNILGDGLNDAMNPRARR